MLRFPKQADPSAVAPSSPIVLLPRFAVLLGFTLPSDESSTDVRGLLWSTTEIRGIPSPFRSALREWSGPNSPKSLATMASADFSLRRVMHPLGVILSNAKRDLPR